MNDYTARRIRLSLDTHDLSAARELHDLLFVQFGCSFQSLTQKAP
jgi:hypothetical protein